MKQSRIRKMNHLGWSNVLKNLNIENKALIEAVRGIIYTTKKDEGNSKVL